ncbi:MAG: hypothetical protein IT247_04385 [Bacteroidia bacterium]|nr:hypothetical protein [Bacteroidia bacterium]
MESKQEEIFRLLSTKACTKQFVYRNMLNVFQKFKQQLQHLEENLSARMASIDNHVELKFYDKGPFEAQLKFSGDTMVFMMHTNVFDFPDDHHIMRLPYIAEDKMREYCGLIQVYNFLSDSIKYNRNGDIGILIGRIFINKDNHFFIEGKRPLSFLFNDITHHEMNEENVQKIIEESMLFCLNFDLVAPPVDAVSFITVEQKNIELYSSGLPTSKALGFQMNKDAD